MTRVGSPKTCVFDMFSGKYDRELDREEKAKKNLSKLRTRTKDTISRMSPKIYHD